MDGWMYRKFQTTNLAQIPHPPIHNHGMYTQHFHPSGHDATQCRAVLASRLLNDCNRAWLGMIHPMRSGRDSVLFGLFALVVERKRLVLGDELKGRRARDYLFIRVWWRREWD